MDNKYLRLNDISAYKIAFVLSNYVWDIVIKWDYFAKDTSRPYGEMLLWPFTKKYFISPFSIFTDIHKANSNEVFIQSLFNLHNLWAISIEIMVLLPILGMVIIMKKRKARLNAINR